VFKPSSVAFDASSVALDAEVSFETSVLLDASVVFFAAVALVGSGAEFVLPVEFLI